MDEVRAVPRSVAVAEVVEVEGVSWDEGRGGRLARPARKGGRQTAARIGNLTE